MMEIIDRDAPVIQRDWQGRMEVVNSLGVNILSSRQIVVPTPFEIVISTTIPFYIRNFSSHSDVISSLVKKQIQVEDWKFLNDDETLKSNLLSVMSENNVLIARFKQSLSDSISVRKKDCRDVLFRSLNYIKLTSTPERYDDNSNITKEVQIEIKERLQKTYVEDLKTKRPRIIDGEKLGPRPLQTEQSSSGR